MKLGTGGQNISKEMHEGKTSTETSTKIYQTEIFDMSSEIFAQTDFGNFAFPKLHSCLLCKKFRNYVS